MATMAEFARRYWDAEESRDVDRVLAFFAPDAAWTAIGLRLRGREAIREPYSESARIYPKLTVEIGRILGDDHEAAIEWTAHYVDNTGRPLDVSGVNIVRVKNELIESLTVYMDPAPLLTANTTT